MSRFRRIFEIAQCRNMVVKEAYKEHNGRTWEVNDHRNLKDWEVQEYENLLNLLESQQLSNKADRVKWKMNQNGLFSAKSYYCFIRGEMHVPTNSFPAKQI